ncbi:MAG: hypothetical protein ATN36_05255 [Epulopiscium sp. Nele67-Bin005]|nr:MAG: hypothetical protein ATN36_05255 [Epulopiscium sp. Nele67-Bin005]
MKLRNRKLLVSLLAISMSLNIVGCSTANNRDMNNRADVVFAQQMPEIIFDSYQLRDNLNTTVEIVLYTGEQSSTNHSHTPKEGYQYLILDTALTIPNGYTFDRNEIKLMGEGGAFYQLEPNFLDVHNYKPLTNNTLTGGLAKGDIVFEVPLDIDINYLKVAYLDVEVPLNSIEQLEVGANSIVKDTNIPITSGAFSVDIEKIEENLRDIAERGAYTLNNPYIIQDPYEKAPLTALAIFDTIENAEITIKIAGKNEYGNVEYTIPNSTQTHLVPIVGLYAGQTNEVIIEANSNGNIERQVIQISTPDLPNDIYDMELEALNISPADAHFTRLSAVNGYNTIIDMNGDIRWYYKDRTNHSYSHLENGNMLVNKNSHEHNYLNALINQTSTLCEIDVLGKVYNTYNLNDLMHHDFISINSHEVMYTGHNTTGIGLEDTIYRIDLEKGEVIEVIDYNNILDRYRKIVIDTHASEDWLHMNAIAYNDDEDSILISAKKQGVFKIDNNRELTWILAPHEPPHHNHP